jgi:hypothetical protein
MIRPYHWATTILGRWATTILGRWAANKFADMIRPFLPCYNRRALPNSSIHHPHNYCARYAPEHT